LGHKSVATGQASLPCQRPRPCTALLPTRSASPRGPRVGHRDGPSAPAENPGRLATLLLSLPRQGWMSLSSKRAQRLRLRTGWAEHQQQPSRSMWSAEVRCVAAARWAVRPHRRYGTGRRGRATLATQTTYGSAQRSRTTALRPPSFCCSLSRRSYGGLSSRFRNTPPPMVLKLGDPALNSLQAGWNRPTACTCMAY
jgi:hypothetical protein